MTDREKLNQPNYTKPVEDRQSNISQNNMKNEGFYLNSESFPPRGSFINIPEDILFSNNNKLIDEFIENKINKIGSDLYKKAEKKKE